jgi:RsiW-degrading membrane proteinase PrsW (M82 family)
MVIEQPTPGDKSRVRLSRSTVFPLVGGRSAWSQEHLLPIFATIAVGIALLLVAHPGEDTTSVDQMGRVWLVYWILALYMAFLVNCYINEMCLRARRLWLLAAVALSTYLLLESSVWEFWFHLFHRAIPSAQWRKSDDSVVRLAGWFVGVGLGEEGFKALPLFAVATFGGALAFLGRRAKGRWGKLLTAISNRVGLSEPLDGIVLGVASGSGFFINETLNQYVPHTMASAKGAGAQAFDGLVLLLSRGLPHLADHSAWSGLFGYFIGLAVMRPNRAIVLLPIGWLSAAALHGAWDGIGTVVDSGLIIIGFLLLLGLLSYALLAGAIFKAREISPRAAARAAAGMAPEEAPREDAPMSSDWD